MKKRKIIRDISRLCFVIYMAFLVYFLFLSDEFGRSGEFSLRNINLVPFREIKRFVRSLHVLPFRMIVINLLGNVCAFVPFGALIRWVIDKKIRWYQACGYTFLFSLCVEVLQLVGRVGVFDVDDLILNTFGGLLGFWVYYLLLLVNQRSESRDKGKCL